MARTDCAFAAATCRSAPARTRHDGQVLPAYGLQDLPIENQNPKTQSKPNALHPQVTLEEIMETGISTLRKTGHFYFALT